jgi:hypothetical protein
MVRRSAGDSVRHLQEVGRKWGKSRHLILAIGH